MPGTTARVAYWRCSVRGCELRFKPIRPTKMDGVLPVYVESRIAIGEVWSGKVLLPCRGFGI